MWSVKCRVWSVPWAVLAKRNGWSNHACCYRVGGQVAIPRWFQPIIPVVQFMNNVVERATEIVKHMMLRMMVTKKCMMICEAIVLFGGFYQFRQGNHHRTLAKETTLVYQ